MSNELKQYLVNKMGYFFVVAKSVQLNQDILKEGGVAIAKNEEEMLKIASDITKESIVSLQGAEYEIFETNGELQISEMRGVVTPLSTNDLSTYIASYEM